MTFLLAFGAAARLTRLITDDYLTRYLRVWVVRRTGVTSDLSYLVTCAWCSGLWACGGMFTLAYFYGTAPWFIWPAAALAASWVYGLIATHLDGTEQ
ncbi:hypothetical protein [Nocardia sp. SYP-A9097]|uniref:hypothetical protein n=1 Tax=Nocardia sp. SYP-A9097 TaxID=2663237 RepID=UPI00129B1D06|nr:hypothetical protein [Nocardia sp. SYP-A9097]